MGVILLLDTAGMIPHSVGHKKRRRKSDSAKFLITAVFPS